MADSKELPPPETVGEFYLKAILEELQSLRANRPVVIDSEPIESAERIMETSKKGKGRR